MSRRRSKPAFLLLTIAALYGSVQIVVVWNAQTNILNSKFKESRKFTLESGDLSEKHALKSAFTLGKADEQKQSIEINSLRSSDNKDGQKNSPPIHALSVRQADSNGACQIPPSQGPEGRMGFQALLKIQSAMSSATNSHQQNAARTPRLLCIVVTDSTHHSTTLPAILETYAAGCDGFLAVSNQTDARVQAVDISGGNDWERLLRIWKFVRENYTKVSNTTNQHDINFEAFHFSTESTYVIPENLKKMLVSFENFAETAQPLYLGGAVVAMRKAPEIRHCGGKAGYTLNSAALELVNHLAECSVPLTKEGIPSRPTDQTLAYCLKEMASIECTKTVDETSALRYIEFGIDYQAKFGTNKKKYVKKTPIKVKPLAEYHGIYIRGGLDGIASDAVSMSVLDYWGVLISDQPGFTIADAIRRFYAILHHRCRAVWDDPPVLALDEDGTPGYIHDPTYLQRHPLNLTLNSKGDDYGVCDLPFGKGKEGAAGFEGLKKIRVFQSQKQNTGHSKTPKKVLCMIYTHSGRHPTRLRAIAETYGPRCDGFFAASNLTDRSLGAINLLHEGPEEYENMWLKIRSMWKYTYQHYSNDYDFFHIGGDDHYLIPENLLYMVTNGGSPTGPFDDSQPLFLGGNMIDFPNSEYRYCGGGSGYTLNRAALRLLMDNLFDSYECRPHHRASDEDRIISSCFRSAGILCMDTNDSRNETRYHQASVDFHSKWTLREPAVWHPIPLERVHGIASLELLGQISESSVSFHLKGIAQGVQDRGMRRYHAVLHNLCEDSN